MSTFITKCQTNWPIHVCALTCVFVCCVCRCVGVLRGCVAAPKRYETARWNECLLSKPCRSKLILVSDVNLRIELLCGGGPCWHLMVWRSKLRVCVWMMLHLPFPNVTEGPTPEERAHNVWPSHVCPCGCVHIKIISAIKTFKHIVSTDVWRARVHMKARARLFSLSACSSPLNPVLYSLIASLIFTAHSKVQFSNECRQNNICFPQRGFFFFCSQVFECFGLYSRSTSLNSQKKR